MTVIQTVKYSKVRLSVSSSDLLLIASALAFVLKFLSG